MKCAWDELLAILPVRIRKDVDTLGKDSLQELRMRVGLPIELVCGTGNRWLTTQTTLEELNYVINTASQYSPWAASSVSQGFITASGGHRIGICGNVARKDGRISGIRTPSSLCIRVARDFPGVAANAASIKGNVLILGPPGSGKTTMLRDMIRQISDSTIGGVCVVDERGEIFPTGFYTGRRTDILTGCSKEQGIDIALRTMGPSCIALDEITNEGDCGVLIQSGWCGVRILATAHATSADDLKRRPIYRSLWECGIFDTALILQKDKTWHTERIAVCH